MADLLDVSNALVNLIAAAIYPNGVAAGSVAGAPCRIFPGWPNEGSLDADLRVGIVQISVYPQPNIERVTTRYPQDWKVATTTQSTLSGAIVGSQIIISGVVTAGHYLTLIVKGKPYSYAALGSDTLITVAQALTALLAVDMTATSIGSMITLPANASGRITCRNGAPGTVVRELRRQQRGYQIIVWAPTPALRSSVAVIVDQALAADDFLTLPDTTSVWLTYRASNETDKQESALLYRRDIMYWAEYATTQTMAGYPITATLTGFATIGVGAGDLTVPAAIDVTPVLNIGNADPIPGQLVGTLYGQAMLAGSFGGAGSIALVGNVQGTAALTGALIVTGSNALVGAVPGSGSLGGNLSQAVALVGTVPGAGLLGGALSQGASLAGNIPKSGGLTGSMSVVIALTGNVLGSATLSGTLSTGVNLVGTVPGLGSLTGAMSVAIALTGNVPGAATMTGALTVTGATSFLLREDGFYILREDGSHIVRET